MIKIMTSQEHHALYCQCGGFNEMDVEAVTVMREIVEQKPTIMCEHETGSEDIKE